MIIQIHDQTGAYLGTYDDQTGAYVSAGGDVNNLMPQIAGWLWANQGYAAFNNGVAEYTIDTTDAANGNFAVTDYFLTPPGMDSNVVMYQGNTPPISAAANAILQTLTGQQYKYDAQGLNPVPYAATASGTSKLWLYGAIALIAYAALSGGSSHDRTHAR